MSPPCALAVFTEPNNRATKSTGMIIFNLDKDLPPFLECAPSDAIFGQVSCLVNGIPDYNLWLVVGRYILPWTHRIRQQRRSGTVQEHRLPCVNLKWCENQNHTG